VRWTGIRHTYKSQSLDHVVCFNGAIERADLHAVHHPFAHTGLADDGIADTRLCEAPRHGLGISA
jgi:hypothetical protein